MKKVLYLGTMIFCMVFSLLFLQNQKVSAAASISRLSGLDRYQTSIEIAKAGWTTSNNVVLATGENFPDALCSSPLAKVLNAPILLTNKSYLSSELANELKSLNVKNVYIIGGEGVISKSVESKIESLTGANIIRLFGADRYQTSIKIADFMYKHFDISREIVAVTGVNFPDALSMAPIAAKLKMPIILTERYSIPPNTYKLLTDYDITKTFIIGGSPIISDGVMANYPNPERIYGSDRFSTNIRIINRFSTEMDFSKLFIATGNDFPDALSGAALAAKSTSPLYLVSSSLSGCTINSLYDYFNSKDCSVTVLGGTGAVTQSTLYNIRTASYKAPDKITLGTSADDVHNLLGNCNSKDVFDDVIVEYYDKCWIYLSAIDYRVVGWNNHSGETDIDMGPISADAPPITLGSSDKEVFTAIGTPESIDNFTSFDNWKYSDGSVVVMNKRGRVIGWVNNGMLKIYMGLKNPSINEINIGSSAYDVIEAYGTPEIVNQGTYSNKYWQYGQLYISFDENLYVIGGTATN